MAIIPSTGKFRNKIESLWRVADAAWFGRDVSTYDQVPAILNGEFVTGVNAAGTGTVNMIGVDGSNVTQIPGPANIGNSNITLNNPTIAEMNNQFINPGMLKTVTYNETLNASIGTTPFFIADQTYTVVAVSYVNKTACTSTGTVTVTKDTGTAVPGGGTALLTAPIACTAVANTVTPGTLVTSAAITLAAGDRLSALFAGTLTTLAGVVITVSMVPTAAGDYANVFWRVNGDIATNSFFQANRDMVVTGVKAVYGTAFAGAVTIDITKDTGTAAAGGGTTILAAAMAGDGAINTVISPALTATTATLSMAAGDRLAVKFSATTTGALLAIVVYFQPIYQRKEVVWQLAPTAQLQVAQCFFVADRAYEVVDASCIFDVTDGGAAKLGVTIDKGTTVPGAGNVVQTDNANAGFDVNATARTTQFMTPASLHLRLMSPGDRLGLKVAGTAGNLASVAITVSLRPWY